MAHTRLSSGLPLDPNSPLYKLITSIPDVKTNPEGKIARNAIVAEIKKSLPGFLDNSEFGESVQAFNRLFYPNTVPWFPGHGPTIPYQKDVRTVFVFNDDWWAGFSTALLCQSMYKNTSISFDIEKINNMVTIYNMQFSIFSKIPDWYAYIIKNHFIKYTGDFNKAKQSYIDHICTAGFVNYRMISYDNGRWTDGDWELFHHWIKLKALGASDNEINSTIQRLRNLGLKIFDEVNENTWKGYTKYFTPILMTSDDIEGESRYNQTKEIDVYYREWVCYGHNNCAEEVKSKKVPQGLSQAFAEKYAQDYYIPPSSCFSGNTLVLMADGSLKPIKDVRVGESVKTTSGARKVALVSMPPKGNRVMYHINGFDFGFTKRHPFINPTLEQPRYLAVSPMEALLLLPTLGSEGIGRISEGSKLLGYNPQEMVTHPVTVNSVTVFDEFPGNHVYDLVLDLHDSGQFEYIIGTQEALFVVSSELPSFANANYSDLLAKSVIFHMISELHPVINQLYSKLDMEAFRKQIIDAIHKLPHLMFSAKIPAKEKVLTIKNKTEFIQNFKNTVKAFTMDLSYNPAAGIVFDYLMAILFRHLSSAIDMGHRYIPLDVGDSSSVLAVTLVDIQVTGECSLEDTLQHMSIIVKTGGVTVTYELSDKVVAEEYRVKIKEVLYLPIESSVNDRNFSIEFKSEMRFEAFTHPIIVPFSGLMCRKITLFTLSPEGDRMAAGECHIDMRCLTIEEMENEKKRKRQCSDDELLEIANHFGHIGVDEMKKLLN